MSDDERRDRCFKSDRCTLGPHHAGPCTWGGISGERVGELSRLREAVFTLNIERDEALRRLAEATEAADELRELVRIVSKNCARDDAVCCADSYHLNPECLSEPWKSLLARTLDVPS